MDAEWWGEGEGYGEEEGDRKKLRQCELFVPDAAHKYKHTHAQTCQSRYSTLLGMSYRCHARKPDSPQTYIPHPLLHAHTPTLKRRGVTLPHARVVSLSHRSAPSPAPLAPTWSLETRPIMFYGHLAIRNFAVAHVSSSPSKFFTKEQRIHAPPPPTTTTTTNSVHARTRRNICGVGFRQGGVQPRTAARSREGNTVFPACSVHRFQVHVTQGGGGGSRFIWKLQDELFKEPHAAYIQKSKKRQNTLAMPRCRTFCLPRPPSHVLTVCVHICVCVCAAACDTKKQCRNIFEFVWTCPETAHRTMCTEPYQRCRVHKTLHTTETHTESHTCTI